MIKFYIPNMIINDGIYLSLQKTEEEMKKISKIEYQKNNINRVNIFINDKFEFGIDIDVMIKYGLHKNMYIDDSLISEILLSENKTKAYNYAISLLGKGPKTEKQVVQKMKDKGYDPETINKTIEKLKLNNYINDSEYCEKFIHDKINFSKDGKRKIKDALYYKGIDTSIIDEKLSVISDEDEFERAYELSIKKLKTLSNLDPQKKKIKLYNFLLNKGFDYGTVNKILSKLIK